MQIFMMQRIGSGGRLMHMGPLLAILLLAGQAQDLSRLLEQLSGDDIDQREAAVLALSAMGPAAREALLPLRASTDLELARLARRTIGHIDWDPYLPAYARPVQHAAWEQLGSEDFRHFQSAFAGVAQSARSSLGLARKFQDETDEERKKLLLPHAWTLALNDPTIALLHRWAEELPPDAFWKDDGTLPNTLLQIFSSELVPLEVERWRKLLRSPARSCRYLAGCVLGSRGDRDGLQALIEFIGVRDTQTGDRPIWILQQHKFAPAREKILAEAAREWGSSAAFYAMEAFGWEGELATLQAIAARGEDVKLFGAHRALLKAGDRSELPRLLEKLAGQEGHLVLDRGRVDAALLYDTDEAIAAVLDRLDRVKFWGAHGVDVEFSFGPNGTRILWQRLLRESREGKKDGKTAMYLWHFADRASVLERVREALRGEPPAMLRSFCIGQLQQWMWTNEATAEDVERLRAAIGDSRAEYILLGRQDPVLLLRLLERLEKAPTAETLQSLRAYDLPALKGCFLRHAAAPFPVAMRAAALPWLAKHPDPETAAFVAGVITSEEPVLRVAALSTLAGFPSELFRGREEALEKSYRLSAGSSYDSAPLDHLARLDPSRAERLAREILQGAPKAPYRARTALLHLLRSPRAEDEALVRPYLESPDFEVSRRALEVLLAIRPEAALPGLFRAAAGGSAEMREGAYELLGRSGRPEAAEFLSRAAFTERPYTAQAAIEAIGRLGGPAAEAFARTCAAESDRGRVVPAEWPIAAGMIRAREALPSILRRLQRFPDRFLLWAADRLMHAAAYESVAPPEARMLKPRSFEEACRFLAEAHSLEAVLSPALAEAVARRVAECEQPRERETHVACTYDLRLHGRLEETLLRWKPGISWRHYSGGVSSGWEDLLLWSHVLEGRRLLFLTPEEARARLLGEAAGRR